MAAILQVPTSNSLSYTLDAGYTSGGTTLTLSSSVAGVVQYPGICVVDKQDTSGTPTPSKRTYYKFTGVSGAQLTGVTLADGTDQDHSVGAIVEFVPDVKWAQSLSDAMANVVDPSTGALDTTKVVDLTTSQTLTNKILTSPTVSNPTFTGTNTEPKIQGASSGTQFPQVIGAYDNGNSGTSKTIDWSKGDRQFLTLTGNVTIDFSNAAAGQTLTLVMLQDGTGGRTIAWTPTITWQDGITWGTSYYTTTIAKYTIVVIQYINSAYLGNVSKFV